jgi:hypothetical protein
MKCASRRRAVPGRADAHPGVIGGEHQHERRRRDHPARDLYRCAGRRLAAYDSAMSSSLTVRPARAEDIAQMARVNVHCWQDTYRGLMSHAVLDDPGFLTAGERFWTCRVD